MERCAFGCSGARAGPNVQMIKTLIATSGTAVNPMQLKKKQCVPIFMYVWVDVWVHHLGWAGKICCLIQSSSESLGSIDGRCSRWLNFLGRGLKAAWLLASFTPLANHLSSVSKI